MAADNVSEIQFRVGLVGCGRIGALGDDRAKTWKYPNLWLPYSHASAIQAAGAALVAVCDLERASAELAATRFGVRAAYSDFRQMIENENLDVIAIATRTSARKDILSYAAESGVKGFYCEKPLSQSLEESDELARLIVSRKISFIYGSQRRYMPGFRMARKILGERKLGTVREIHIAWSPGTLLWRHPHSVDLACFLAGDALVTSVSAKMEFDRSDLRENVLDADPLLQEGFIGFANGIGARISCSEANRVEVIGEKGRLSIEDDGAKILMLADGKEQIIEILHDRSGTLNAFNSLLHSLRGNPPEYSVEQAVVNQEILFGWLECALAGGRELRFPLERSGLVITGRTGDKYA